MPPIEIVPRVQSRTEPAISWSGCRRPSSTNSVPMSLMSCVVDNRPRRLLAVPHDPTCPLSFSRGRISMKSATMPVKNSLPSSISDSGIWRLTFSMNWSGGSRTSRPCVVARRMGILPVRMGIPRDRSPEGLPGVWPGDILEAVPGARWGIRRDRRLWLR